MLSTICLVISIICFLGMYGIGRFMADKGDGKTKAIYKEIAKEGGTINYKFKGKQSGKSDDGNIHRLQRTGDGRVAARLKQCDKDIPPEQPSHGLTVSPHNNLIISTIQIT